MEHTLDKWFETVIKLPKESRKIYYKHKLNIMNENIKKLYNEGSNELHIQVMIKDEFSMKIFKHEKALGDDGVIYF